MSSFMIAIVLITLVLASILFVSVISKELSEKQEKENTLPPAPDVPVIDPVTEAPQEISQTLTIEDPANTSITVTETVVVEEPVKVTRPRTPRTNKPTKPATKRAKAKK